MAMLLTDILTPQRVKVPLDGKTKQDVIAELVDVLAADGQVRDRDAALEAVLQREKTRTTGIGGGLAIPHGKCAAVSELVMAVGTSPEGIDFESIDGRPVHLVILLLSPVDKTGPHIQALARISRMLSSEAARKHMWTAPDARTLYDVIQERQGPPPA